MKKRTNYLLTLLAFIFFVEPMTKAYAGFFDPDMYSIKWYSPSKNASESMPLGNKDIGCNVWVENGDILVYFQRSGSFSENGEYLKLGRLRLSLTPNPFNEDNSFNQTLHLKEGYIELSAKPKGTGSGDVVRIWVDRFTSSVQFDLKTVVPTQVKAAYESWRTEDKLLTDNNRGRFGCFTFEGYPGEVKKSKDVIEFVPEGVLFYHRNPKETLSPNVMITQQGLDAYKDQIINKNSLLTMGGLLSGEGFEKEECGSGTYYGTPFRSWSIRSISPKAKHHFQITTHIKQTEDVNEWKSELLQLSKMAIDQKGNFKKNVKWWNNTWQQSWIVTDPYRKDSDERLWQMGRNYQLMRYQLLTNLNGEFPSKFNGGNFTVDPVFTDAKMVHDPDWRAWGGDIFTAQNQRLLYWPMLKSGDFDGMKSQFNLYEWGLAGASLKSQVHFGHDGALFCEYASASGLDFGAGWGWEDTSGYRKRGEEIPFGFPVADATKGYGQSVEHGIMANECVSYHWESQVEYAYMMLEYHRFTGKPIDRYLPFIKKSLQFFDYHYQKREQMRTGKPLDANGKLVFFPSTSCESYRGATNPSDLIAGLNACIESLLSIGNHGLTPSEHTYFEEYKNRLPELSFGLKEGNRIALPAKSYLRYQNVECPQFYPLFPFNRYDIEDAEMQTFRNTWKYGTFPKDMVISWHQDGIFFARMGMTEEALEYNKKKLADSPRRFPTFWGPGHDWTPDHNWGGSGMIGLQEMLLQTVKDKIHILPAWPAGKDVCFKLYAPHGTTVEVEYIDGKIRKLEVTPRERKKDIVISL